MLAPDTTKEFAFEVLGNECQYDFRVITILEHAGKVYVGKNYVFKDLEVCETRPNIVLDQPSKQSFVVVNEGESDIYAMYVRPNNNPRGIDRLRTNVLAAGDSLWVDMVGGFDPSDCHFDIEVAENQDEVVLVRWTVRGRN